MDRQPILRTSTVTIPQGTHWKIEASQYRRYLVIMVDDSSEGFDLAFIGPDETLQESDWVSGIGKGSTPGERQVVSLTEGCASEIHFRDTDNTGAEVIAVLSDVKAVFTQVQ